MDGEHLNSVSVVPIAPYSLEDPLEPPGHLVDLLELHFRQPLRPSYALGSASL